MNYNKECEHCGRSYETSNSGGRFCRLHCAVEYTNPRRGAPLNESRVCMYCLGKFEAPVDSLNRFCSAICKNSFSFLGQRGNLVKEYDR